MKISLVLFNKLFAINAHNSAKIEGNRLTLASTERLLFNPKTVWVEIKDVKTTNVYADENVLLKDYREIVGFRNAYQYFIQLITQPNKPLSITEIKHFHYQLMSLVEKANKTVSRAGNFRDKMVYVGASAFQVSEPENIESDLKVILKYYHNLPKTTFVQKIASLAHLHALFETIHPFFDGNGRTGRIILSLESIRMNLTPISINELKRNAYLLSLEKMHDATSFISKNIFERVNLNKSFDLEAVLASSYLDIIEKIKNPRFMSQVNLITANRKLRNPQVELEIDIYNQLEDDLPESVIELINSNFYPLQDEEQNYEDYLQLEKRLWTKKQHEINVGEK